MSMLTVTCEICTEQYQMPALSLQYIEETVCPTCLSLSEDVEFIELDINRWLTDEEIEEAARTSVVVPPVHLRSC